MFLFHVKFLKCEIKEIAIENYQRFLFMKQSVALHLNFLPLKIKKILKLCLHVCHACCSMRYSSGWVKELIILFESFVVPS